MSKPRYCALTFTLADCFHFTVAKMNHYSVVRFGGEVQYDEKLYIRLGHILEQSYSTVEFSKTGLHMQSIASEGSNLRRA